jgi:hypothetical protein
MAVRSTYHVVDILRENVTLRHTNKIKSDEEKGRQAPV